MCGARRFFAKRSLRRESKKSFIAPLPPGSPAGTRGKGEEVSDRGTCPPIGGLCNSPFLYSVCQMRLHTAGVVFKIRRLRLSLIYQLLQRNRFQIIMYHFFKTLPGRECDAKTAPGAFVDRTLETCNRVQRPFDQADNLPKRDFLRREQQAVASGFTSPDSQDSSRCKRSRKSFHVFF